MTDLLTYHRSEHHASCPCKDCIAYDAAVFAQEHPKAGWDVASWLTTERQRDLNWDLEPGHCILCGGTSAHVNDQMEHYQKLRYNTQTVTHTQDDLYGDRPMVSRTTTKAFTSLLLHKAGSLIAVYKRILTNKTQLIDWACLILELNPEKCFAVASREHEEWLEIRLGFWELQDESYDQRISRRTKGSRANHSGTDSATSQRGGEVQGVPTLAR